MMTIGEIGMTVAIIRHSKSTTTILRHRHKCIILNPRSIITIIHRNRKFIMLRRHHDPNIMGMTSVPTRVWPAVSSVAFWVTNSAQAIRLFPGLVLLPVHFSGTELVCGIKQKITPESILAHDFSMREKNLSPKPVDKPVFNLSYCPFIHCRFSH
jgi:hypothetical protein